MSLATPLLSGMKQWLSGELYCKYQRVMETLTAARCDLCLRWMTLTFQLSSVGKVHRGTWVCSRNHDLEQEECEASEQKGLPMETFQRTQRQGRKHEKIHQQQEVLKTVLSPPKLITFQSDH